VKVVLFCGGLGLRMRASEDSAPKPMTTIGERPVLWHVMRYYAYFGHTDFILCLGHGARAVKDYFLRYDETASNDFTLSKGGTEIELYGGDIADWRITFVDTGIETAIGERLRRVRRYLDDDDVFLANYGDVLTDAPMNDIIDKTLASDVVGSLLAVKPQDSFHVVGLDADSKIRGFTAAADMNLRINGGYFVLRNEIFDYLNEGEDLVMDACRRAADVGKMLAIPYDGFWAPMDTLKERNALEIRHQTGNTPWMLWRKAAPHAIVPTIDVPDVAL
jgi:glucose-1-phosphate cytidylyltransferase